MSPCAQRDQFVSIYDRTDIRLEILVCLKTLLLIDRYALSLRRDNRMNDVVIAGPARLPIGRFGGTLKDVSDWDLGTIAIAEDEGSHVDF